MFIFGYVKRIHPASHGKVTEHWTNFVEDLFNTPLLELIVNNEMLEWSFLRRQWDGKMATVKI